MARASITIVPEILDRQLEGGKLTLKEAQAAAAAAASAAVAASRQSLLRGSRMPDRFKILKILCQSDHRTIAVAAEYAAYHQLRRTAVVSM